MTRDFVFNHFVNLLCFLPDPQGCTTNALLLLSALLPSVTLKRGWKPSRIEHKRGLIIHCQTLDETELVFDARNEKLVAQGYTQQPAVLLVGQPSDYSAYVRINKTYYHCDSLLKAVDVCFKIFKTLGTQFPQDSLLSWLFLDEYVYNFLCSHHLKYTSLGNFVNDLEG